MKDREKSEYQINEDGTAVVGWALFIFFIILSVTYVPGWYSKVVKGERTTGEYTTEYLTGLSQKYQKFLLKLPAGIKRITDFGMNFTKVPLERNVSGLKLGMTLQETQAAFNLREKEDPYISLLRKHINAESAAKEQTKESNLKISYFVIESGLSNGIETISLRFQNEVLYEIGLHYKKQFVTEVNWEQFVKIYVEKYGSPKIEKQNDLKSRRSCKWLDSKTILEVSGGNFNAESAYYNVFYADIISKRNIDDNATGE